MVARAFILSIATSWSIRSKGSLNCSIGATLLSSAAMSTQMEKAAARPAEGAPSPDHALIQLLTGAWAMQAVAAACKLGIPDVLADSAKSADEVAAKAKTDAGATYRLMRGLASLGVFERRADGRFANTGVGALL